MANGSQDEILVGCRFYFSADGLEDKMVLELSGLSAENPAAGGDKVLGSGKGAVNLRQAAPTQVKFNQVVVKVVATTNMDLYKWYEDCNKNAGGASQWKEKRKVAHVFVYDQAGTPKAQWDMVDSYPTKYEGPQLQAGSNDVANETLTLVHTGIKRIL
jgi:phage tail-like protein